ncbi:MAG: DNA polymerase/3'-5' exonuclease PolX [Candidatus Colwellbacteria bacterium]|nr:DNA polymerase/3'-5' exonuclease PolX [Candidatus Colwellbacteria bacterium]
MSRRLGTTNQDIANVLSEMAMFYEMDDIPFKPRAYEDAADAVRSLDEELRDIYNRGGIEALDAVKGIGRGIASHIEDILTKGHFKEYERLKKKMPVDVARITAVEGIGPKMVKTLWKKLNIRTLRDLEKAARAGKIRALPHFGEKSEQKIIRGIEFLKKSGGRRLLGFILPDVRKIENMIRSFNGVGDVVTAGSVRRRKETIGDLDFLVTSKTPKNVMEQFVRLPFVDHVYGKGITKTNVRLKNGIDADVRVVPQKSFGAALNYFTGSKEHNIALREIAIKKGWKLNEYGLFAGSRTSRGKSDFLAGRTEEEIYRKLGLRSIEPEMREMTGEIEAARENRLPHLIEYGALKGDLQVQTDWTDGENSIEEMAKAAQEAGLEYIAITDHTKSLAMTGGADEKKLLQQMREIDRLNKKFKDVKFKILKGAEVNIGAEGTLDIKDEALAQLDVVGAAVHSHFNLSRTEQTARIVRVMENPHVDIIFHLTGRIIHTREPIDIDIDEIIKHAKRTGTILEIDAYPVRLDIKNEYVKKCVEAGVKMSIDSDAHSTKHFEYLEFGIAEARRGWAEKKDIINAWPLEKMLQFLK